MKRLPVARKRPILVAKMLLSSLKKTPQTRLECAVLNSSQANVRTEKEGRNAAATMFIIRKSPRLWLIF
jgi:N-acetylglutamate synthase/N-acetylornithine aminotransferase